MSPAEEKEFLGVIKRLSFGPFVMHGVEAKRRIADFGLRYVRPTRSLTEAPEFPPELEPCACGKPRGLAESATLSQNAVLHHTAKEYLLGVRVPDAWSDTDWTGRTYWERR
jgi:hypothetical protein